MAQTDRYRVEVIVLTHLNHSEAPEEVKWTDDFSTATDFLTPPAEETEEQEEDAESEESPLAEEEAVVSEVLPDDALDSDLELPGEEELVEDPAMAVVHVEEMSDVMQEAWRRLRLSAPFRPEQYLSWEQGSEAPFPSLRLHDLQVVMVDDPYADLRILPEEDADAAESEEGPAIFGDPASMEAIPEDDEPPLPDPTYYYRLDGTVMLKKTRFLHLELDLLVREAVYEEEIALQQSLLSAAPSYEDSGYEDPVNEESAPPQPSSFLEHRLTQSRQVKTGRMEYFDSPVLGMLAFITAVEAEDEATP